MIKDKNQLFEHGLIFQEDFTNLDQAFEIMADKLFKLGLTKEHYLESIKEREKNYPTGIDLSVIEKDFPNVAIPHTESEYCNATKVILVKLQNEINVKNMMDSDSELKVKYLFMILNKAGEEQANILANIMDFVTNKNNINSLEKAETIEELYNVVKNN
ncbi:PTS sugar transporter subunit IIA [Clostridium vincentii]|uniref:PTS system galactitol-specific transporter subunit IIA n=1 Tax=Clostridium vincentii TaxID=52704 RepID=A0A2T0BET6_9CLOT|nr:PTS sugar transporter subunit IIA [Clostridium vincentii]PRR82411.1 PTS system galactitol-specific transporter subunit IIA [Clostridium vincentii]